MLPTRKEIQEDLLAVTKGHMPKGMTQDTVNNPGMCAQCVRQNTEAIFGYAAGNWEVALKALEFMRNAGRGSRYALDYEAAGKALGLAKPYENRQPGDIGYWPYAQFGHTAYLVGHFNGQDWWLENTDASNRPGGTRIFGGNSHIWFTPQSAMGALPRTIITPTVALKKYEATLISPAPTPVKPQPVPAKTEPAPVKTEPSGSIPALVEKRLFLPDANNHFVEVGKVMSISVVGDKLYIRPGK